MFVILDRDESRGSAITILTGPTSVTGIRIEARRRCSNLLVDHLAEMVSAQDAPGQRFAAVYLADPVVNFHTGANVAVIQSLAPYGRVGCAYAARADNRGFDGRRLAPS